MITTVPEMTFTQLARMIAKNTRQFGTLGNFIEKINITSDDENSYLEYVIAPVKALTDCTKETIVIDSTICFESSLCYFFAAADEQCIETEVMNMLKKTSLPKEKTVTATFTFKPIEEIELEIEI